MSRTKAKMVVVPRFSDSEIELGDPEVRASEAKAEARDLHDLTVPEQIAKSKVHFRNYEFNDAKKAFPYHRNLRFIEKMYPYALPTPLLVDQPETPQDLAECRTKAEVLKVMGYRYLILTKSMTLLEALESLGET